DATEVISAARRWTGAAAKGRSTTGNRIVTWNTASGIHVGTRGIGTTTYCRAKDKAIRVTGDGSEGRAAARWHGGAVNPIRTIQPEIVLDRGGETAYANRGDNACHRTDFG